MGDVPFGSETHVVGVVEPGRTTQATENTASILVGVVVVAVVLLPWFKGFVLDLADRLAINKQKGQIELTAEYGDLHLGAKLNLDLSEVQSNVQSSGSPSQVVPLPQIDQCE